MPIQAKRAPFFDHVAEFRKRLMVSVIALIVATLACYQKVINVFILNLVLRPVSPYLPNHSTIYTTGPFESMTFRFQVAFFAGLVAVSPLIIYEIFAFFVPALKKRERKWLIPTVFAAILLFLGGVCFAYFVILGPGFKWLTAQAIGPVRILPSASSYFSGIGLLLVGFGVSFELPLVVFYLIGFGILKYHSVRAGWRYVYVILFVVAAIATPDWSPWPMLGLTAALIALYESSLALTKVVFKRRILEQEIDAFEDFVLTSDLDPASPEYQEKYQQLKTRAEKAKKKLEAMPEKPEEPDEDEDEDDFDEDEDD